MLRVEIEEQAIVDGERFGRRGAGRGKAQHGVGAVAVLVDEVPGDLRRAGRVGASQAQPRQRIGRDIGVPGPYFAPRDRVVLIRVEAKREVEVAQRDVPLPVDPVAFDAQREVAVRRLVRVRRCETRAQQHRQRHDPEFHFARSAAGAGQRGDRWIFEPRLCEPSLDDVHRRSIAGGVGGFGKDEDIRRLALHFPVVEREREGASRVAAQHELEPRVLALVHRVAAGATRLEARAQGLDRRRGFRPPGRALRQREPQQQRIDPGLVADERDRVGGTLLIEEPIAVRAQQIQVSRVGFERRAEVSFGGGVAAAMRDFAQQRLGPGPPGAVDAHGAVERPCERRVGGFRVAGDAVDRGGTDRRVDTGGQHRQASAVVARLGIFPAHRQHRGARQHGLRVSRVPLHDPVEVGAGGIEFVPALQDRRPQHQHGRRRVRVLPPRRERRLRVAEKARVAFGARGADVGRGERRRLRRIVRRLHCGGAQRLQLAELRRAAAGKALQHLRIVGRNVRCRRRDGSERQRRGAHEAAQHTGAAEWPGSHPGREAV